MKKFHDVGYYAYRNDGGSREHGLLKFKFVKIGDNYHNGDVLFTLGWQTCNDHQYWYGTRLSFGTGIGTTNREFENVQYAVKIVGFIIKHYGFELSQEILRGLPELGWIEEAKYELAKAKEFSWEGMYRQLTPELLVYLGLPSLNIPRVIRDDRADGKYVEIDKLAAPELSTWIAKHNGVTLATTVVDGSSEGYYLAQDTLENLAFHEVQLVNGTAQGRTTWVWPYEKEQYLKAYVEWVQNNRPVSVLHQAPSFSPMEILLDRYNRWLHVVKY